MLVIRLSGKGESVPASRAPRHPRVLVWSERRRRSDAQLCRELNVSPSTSTAIAQRRSCHPESSRSRPLNDSETSSTPACCAQHGTLAHTPSQIALAWPCPPNARNHGALHPFGVHAATTGSDGLVVIAGSVSAPASEMLNVDSGPASSRLRCPRQACSQRRPSPRHAFSTAFTCLTVC